MPVELHGTTTLAAKAQLLPTGTAVGEQPAVDTQQAPLIASTATLRVGADLSRPTPIDRPPAAIDANNRIPIDPDALFQALDAGRSLDGLAEEERFLLLTATGGGRVTMRQVPAEQGKALAACDGKRTVEEVAAASGVGMGVMEDVAAGGWVV